MKPRTKALSDSGPIFLFESSTEVSGPDGEGLEDPVIAWELEEPLIGACCLKDDNEFECTMAFELDCVSELGGEYQGDDSACVGSSSGPPVTVSSTATPIAIPDLWIAIGLVAGAAVEYTFAKKRSSE